MPFPTVDEQLAIILRGVAQVETREELRKKLERSATTGQPLRIKYGIDPTGFDVHLGHTVPLRKLRQFQELGHTAVLIIGTATAAVGDPSGRDVSRQGLTPEQIEHNAQTYLTQIAKVIDVTKAEVRSNGEWFNAFRFADMLRLLAHTTIQRMLERDDFTKRIKSGTPIYLHECLYPLMQGYDSVVVRADVELGGTEQLYNLMVGRDLQRAAGQEPQICLTMPILRGLDGEKKMGKSLNNYIGLNEPPKDMFGKTMRIPDSLMKEWFDLLTDFSDEQIATFLSGKPNEAKKALAAAIVRFYHGDNAAAHVLEDWRKQFEEKGDPDDMPEVAISVGKLTNGQLPAVDLIVETKLAASKSEARRKIEEGAFNYGPERTKVTDVKATVAVSDGLVVRLGRKIVRVRVTH
jgi:tyrosyl-tRNA synthetase